MASALTVEQVQFHSAHLSSTTNFLVFPLLVETALYAIFTVLVIASSYILITRGLRSRASKMMLGVALIMYGLSSWEWAIDVHLVRDELKVLLPADLVQPPPDHARRLKVNTALHIAQSIANNICVVLSDSVVCWRVYVVYARNRRVLITALSLLLALSCAIFICNLTQIGENFSSVTTLHRLLPSQLIIDGIALGLSALVNVWATAMIAYEAWRCRWAIRNYLTDTSARNFAEGIMALFVESGIVYTTLWILKNIIIIPQIEPTPYTNYANAVMYQVTGMYPTLIIILVALQKSHLESQFTSYGDIARPASTTLGLTPAFEPSESGATRYVNGSNAVLSVTAESSTEFGSKEAEKEKCERELKPADALSL
ncbi:hypothetical protein DFH06DRAFT_1188336 [Mycena polygramma]|nr:hypothetical protein DFH06DRAFT_1188336 [Mycena polygramma]